MPEYLKRIIIIASFVSGIAAFAANLLTTISIIGIPTFKLGKITFELPKIIVSFGGIDNIQLTFALIIYSIAALVYTNINLKLPNILIFISALIPQILLILWFLAFFKTWFVVHIILMKIFFISIIVLYAIFSENTINTIILHFILIPTQSLFLICFDILRNT